VWRTVVGISGDVRHWGLLRDVNPIIYLPQAQVVSSALTFVLQTSVAPGSLVPAVRSTVRAVDSNLPVVDLDSVDDVVARSVREPRAQTTLMGAFGAVALLLAAIGIYGVMAQLVTTRVHEIGVRMTLGAQRSAILRQFMSECLWQTTAGLAIGMFAGVWLMRAGRDVLFNVKPWDPASLAAAGAVLMLAGLSACVIPARRAMRVDPVEALRQT
jgi:ABC-type antimicrobial peptide transport system permease subunit